MRKKFLGAGVIAAMTGCGSTNNVDGEKATADENGNYLINGSFEEADFTGWTVNNVNDSTEELDIYDRDTDCFEGVQSLHFYSGSSNVDFSAEQTVNGLEEGTFKLTAHIQGDAGEEIKVDGELNGYVNWYTAEIPDLKPADGEITVGVRVTTAPGGWGTIDDLTLVKE